MGKPIVEPPVPWADAGDADAEPRLGQLFRAVPEPRPLSAATLAGVHDRLGATGHFSSARRRLRELVLAGGMLIAGSSLALASWGVAEWWNGRSQPAPARASGQTHAGARTAGRAVSAQGTTPARPEPAAAAVIGDEASGQVPAAKATTDVIRTRREVAPGAADSSALALEANALERVLVKLRRERDAQGALRLLDESQALFVRGSLSLEAEVARLDALLMLGRRDEALQILDHLPFAQVGRGGELRLVRAELRARNDCGRALTDFDVLVGQPLALPLLERAIYGRAACELQVGDQHQALADLNRYLTRFPRGRFVDLVQTRLSRLSAKPTP